MPRTKPGAAGCKARTLSIVLLCQNSEILVLLLEVFLKHISFSWSKKARRQWRHQSSNRFRYLEKNFSLDGKTPPRDKLRQIIFFSLASKFFWKILFHSISWPMRTFRKSWRTFCFTYLHFVSNLRFVVFGKPVCSVCSCYGLDKPKLRWSLWRN